MSRHRGPGQMGKIHVKAWDQRCWGVEVLTLLSCGLWCAKIVRARNAL